MQTVYQQSSKGSVFERERTSIQKFWEERERERERELMFEKILGKSNFGGKI